MSQQVLAQHVYWCLTEDHAVLLDVRKEKYFGAKAQDIALFSSRPQTIYHQPVAALIDGYQEERERIYLRDVLQFLKASMWSVTLLRFRRFEDVVHRLEKRKRSSHIATAADLGGLRSLVAIFLRLQPLLLSTKRQCLRNSLALLEFLAAYGVTATWIIGVHTRPFEAHAWVQQAGVVLNDTPDHVRRYTPILTV